MKELSRHIEVLLLENDCVIVPGLGGFIAHNKSAEFKDSANVFCPPSKTIGFNPQLTINDGLLAQSYMQAYDTDFPDASRKIESVVSQIKETLYKNGQAELDNIGTLYYTMAGIYGFEPYSNAFFSPNLYGLSSFSISPLSALKKNPEAEKAFVKTFELAPEMNDLRFDYANLLATMEKNDEAIVQYKKYISSYPDDSDAYKNLALVYKRTNNIDMALLNYEKAYSKSPSDIDIQKELAYCYHQKQDYKNALKFYDLALKSTPNDYDLLYSKAQVLHADKAYLSAIEIYKTLLEEKENEDVQKNLMSALISLGYDLIDKDQYMQACLSFEEVLAMDDKLAPAYFGLALANEKLKNDKKATYYFERAIALDPDNAEYKTEYEDYKTNAEKLAKTAPVQDEVTESEKLIMQGDSAYKTKDYKQAINAYQKVIEITPNDKETLLKLGNSYRLNKNLNKATYYYNEAIKIDNNFIDAWFNLGLTYANQRNFNSSVNCFEKVVSIDPDYALAYYALGLAYEYKNDNEKAIENYTKYTTYEKDKKLVDTVNNKIMHLQQMQ